MSHAMLHNHYPHRTSRSNLVLILISNMKLLFLILPFLGSVLALVARDLQAACTCEPVVCLDSWPDSCYCNNTAKKNCYEKCGGELPKYQTCPPREVVPEPDPTECQCPEVVCIQSFPEGCYCANNAKLQCYEKCGGEKPVLSVR